MFNSVTPMIRGWASGLRRRTIISEVPGLIPRISNLMGFVKDDLVMKYFNSVFPTHFRVACPWVIMELASRSAHDLGSQDIQGVWTL